MVQAMNKETSVEPIEGRLDREIEMLCSLFVMGNADVSTAAELENLLAERAAASQDKSFMTYVRGSMSGSYAHASDGVGVSHGRRGILRTFGRERAI